MTAPTVEFPPTVQETLRFIKETLSNREMFDNHEQKMVPMTPAKLVPLAQSAIEHLEQLILRQERQKDVFLTKRFGTIFRTLDFDPPVDEQVVIIDIKGERTQGIVRTGSVFKWNAGMVGDRICALNQVEKWRPCVLTDKPVSTHTLKGEVLGALERGRLVRQGAKL